MTLGWDASMGIPGVRRQGPRTYGQIKDELSKDRRSGIYKGGRQGKGKVDEHGSSRIGVADVQRSRLKGVGWQRWNECG